MSDPNQQITLLPLDLKFDYQNLRGAIYTMQALMNNRVLAHQMEELLAMENSKKDLEQAAIELEG